MTTIGTVMLVVVAAAALAALLIAAVLLTLTLVRHGLGLLATSPQSLERRVAASIDQRLGQEGESVTEPVVLYPEHDAD